MRIKLLKPLALMLILASISIAVTIGWQLNTSLDRPGFNVVNFFSYFTILSNLLAGAVFAVYGAKILGGKQTGKTLELMRGGVTIYMVTTGIVYALLLSGQDVQVTEQWINSILHQIIPIVAALQWLLIPPAIKLSVRSWFSWVSFPISYVLYTLIRGSFVEWYPYPFLNPEKPGGYLRVFLYCLVITIVVVGLTLVTGWVGNRLRAEKK